MWDQVFHPKGGESWVSRHMDSAVFGMEVLPGLGAAAGYWELCHPSLPSILLFLYPFIAHSPLSKFQTFHQLSQTTHAHVFSDSGGNGLFSASRSASCFFKWLCCSGFPFTQSSPTLFLWASSGQISPWAGQCLCVSTKYIIFFKDCISICLLCIIITFIWGSW